MQTTSFAYECTLRTENIAFFCKKHESGAQAVRKGHGFVSVNKDVSDLFKHVKHTFLLQNGHECLAPVAI